MRGLHDKFEILGLWEGVLLQMMRAPISLFITAYPSLVSFCTLIHRRSMAASALLLGALSPSPLLPSVCAPKTSPHRLSGVYLQSQCDSMSVMFSAAKDR